MDNLIIDMIKEISSDIKDVKKDTTDLKVGHAHIEEKLKQHVSEYQSDKQRFNNNIDYTKSIADVVDKKFGDIFNKVDTRVIETDTKITELQSTASDTLQDIASLKESIQDHQFKVATLEDNYISLNYWDKMSKIVYITGGTVLGAISAFIAFLFKHGDGVFK